MKNVVRGFSSMWKSLLPCPFYPFSVNYGITIMINIVIEWGGKIQRGICDMISLDDITVFLLKLYFIFIYIKIVYIWDHGDSREHTEVFTYLKIQIWKTMWYECSMLWTSGSELHFVCVKRNFRCKDDPKYPFYIKELTTVVFFILRTVTIECMNGIEIIVIVVLISADYKK